MADLVIQKITRDPTAAPTFAAAAAAGDTVAVGQATYIEVINGGGSPITVTVNPTVTSVSAGEYGQLPVPAISESVTNAERRKIRIPRAGYSSGGRATVTYSGVTSVTIGAFDVAD